MTGAAPASRPAVTFAEALAVWARLGLLSFGGPAGQIALMHRLLVEERPWLSEQRFLTGLNFCMLLPGPEAMQLATYVGWRLHGWRGGLAAGLLFVLPGALVVLLLAALYAAYGTTPVLSALFFGIKAAVLAIVLEALLRISRRALKGREAWLLAGAAFLAMFAFDVPFPLVVLAAALLGLLRPASQAGADGAQAAPVSWRRTAGTPPCCGLPSGSAPWPCSPSPWARPTSSCSAPGSSPSWPSSPSAAPMRCWPTWPRKRSPPTAGWRPAPCWTASAWPRRRPAR